MIIKTRVYPRAGLVGNPSDGYFGKTISFAFSNFYAEVILYESSKLEILPNTRDHLRFESICQLVEDVHLFGYYGGIRLLKATVKQFYDYCRENHITLDNRNFTIQYHTNIPSQVGLAGSSAIITACLHALMEFYGVSIAKPIQANLILSVEKKELGISAGLQDRVVQVYGGLVYMNFEKTFFENQGYGQYEELDPKLLPSLYLAYHDDLSEGSEVFHNDIRNRFERQDSDVISAIQFWIQLTDQVRECLLKKEVEKLGELINKNFDMRRKIYKISHQNITMIETARSVGASAKFSGSGGAIVGTYQDESMYRNLVSALEARQIKVIQPLIQYPEKK